MGMGKGSSCGSKKSSAKGKKMESYEAMEMNGKAGGKKEMKPAKKSPKKK
jgi:hypothetical protein